MDVNSHARSRLVPEPYGPGWLRYWLERHQHPVSYVLHLVGIPMTLLSLLVGPVVGLLLWSWFWGVGLFLFLGAGGYALQFVGHLIEGNDPGELLIVKRKLGIPVVAIAPPHEPSAVPAASLASQ